MSEMDPNIVVVTQARMSSSRLPGKTLQSMAGTPMLELMIERLNARASSLIHVIATSEDPSDDPIEELCDRLGVSCVRGSLNDVLARYVQALDAFDADLGVRLTGDNAIIDERAVEAGLDAFNSLSNDTYVGICNHLDDRTDPLGYCVEAFDPDALRWLQKQDLTADEHEHVTLGFKNRGLYKSFHILDGDHSHLRWTVDRPDDFDYMNRLFGEVGRGVTGEEALDWSYQNPRSDS